MIPLIESANQPDNNQFRISLQGLIQLPFDSIPVDAPQIQKLNKLLEIGMIACSSMQQKQDNARNFRLDLVQAIHITLQPTNNKPLFRWRRRTHWPAWSRPNTDRLLLLCYYSRWWIGWRLWFRWLGLHFYDRDRDA